MKRYNIILICKQKKWINCLKFILDSIEHLGGIDISLLIVHPQNQYNYEKQYNCVKKVMTSLELEYLEDMKGIRYEVIEKFRKSQLKIENHNYRLYNDYQLDKYYYYTALSFWSYFFEHNKIEYVINIMDRHGYPWELALDIAESQNIKSLCYEVCEYNNTYQINSCGTLHKVKKKNNLNLDFLLNTTFDKSQMPDMELTKNLPERFLYKLGGNLLEDFVHRLFANNWRPRSILHFRYKSTWQEKMYGYMKLRMIANYVDRISVSPDFKEKYIFYALHQEPEAAILARPVLESQLVAIKMLSEALPDNWKLYVKEHPAQYNINNDIGYYFMREAYRFKSKNFYKKLEKMSNVKLIKQKMNSKILIDNAQAVSSITGTVLLEAVQSNKPVIVFSELSITSKCKDAFNVKSFDDVVNAMTKIKNGISPQYDDIESVINMYVLKAKDIPEDISLHLRQLKHRRD